MATKLGALIVLDAAEARRRLLASIVAAGGNRAVAAKALGETHRTFCRHIEKLGLWNQIDQLEAMGAIRSRGNPRRSDEGIRDALRAAHGNVKRAAARLRMPVARLAARMAELGLVSGGAPNADAVNSPAAKRSTRPRAR